MKQNIADLRESYHSSGLDESKIEKNPIKLFENWFNYAVKKNILEPNAMTLATADEDGKPSARIVLLKDFDEKGFVFFTNYNSIKGKQLEQNPNAALVFWWGALARQIKIEGRVEKVSAEESDAYFDSRPRGNQLGAVASNQSMLISDYSKLEKDFAQISEKYKNKKVERPNYWGGYRVKPVMIEFWQGRENRLHDRLRFTNYSSQKWKIERLAP
ncbi:MAG: pyridoxamine 5'-phosphate oxidase [Ignavibacteriae bacterium]|nr:pyridoxamine 5'-phosphate oxidase [Ignavibacteriota bacterium]NOG98861.1 pyridoxamine 5'-phosphate oxidase [Ignavibacteriota bacterium]